jgi:TRAP-type mannitol/chloroaromatic compound transport system permease small subunit
MKIEEKFINILSLAIPFMVIMMLIVVVSRYVFGIGQTGLQELIMYMHGLVFLASAGYLVAKDEHVRVDIFYRDASKEYKHKLNAILGILFLLPIILVILFYSFEFIEMSWKINEISTEAGGLKYVYIQKTLILLLPVSLLLALIRILRAYIWK